jgi:hypothetical protein
LGREIHTRRTLYASFEESEATRLTVSISCVVKGVFASVLQSFRKAIRYPAPVRQSWHSAVLFHAPVPEFFFGEPLLSCCEKRIFSHEWSCSGEAEIAADKFNRFSMLI